ncbi:hypothetical protein AAMO2058_000758100 [Amorphochlora amoebiformis]
MEHVEDKVFRCEKEHIPEFEYNVDDGASAIDNVVDFHQLSIRRHLKAFLCEMEACRKARVERKEAQVYAKHNEEVTTLHDHISHLKEQNFRLTEKKMATMKFYHRVAEKIWTYNKRNDRNIQQRHLKVWVGLLGRIQADQRRLKWFKTHMGQRILRSRMNLWVRLAKDKKLNVTVKFWEDKMKRGLALYISRYEEELSRTREELEKQRAIMREHRKYKLTIEHKMKRAFLRSVKTLNFEAFHLVREMPSLSHMTEIIEKEIKAEDTSPLDLDLRGIPSPQSHIPEPRKSEFGGLPARSGVETRERDGEHVSSTIPGRDGVLDEKKL